MQTNSPREEAFSTQDFISDLEAKYNADDYYFEQELMDLFRPSLEHNQAWGAMLFLELRFYSCMPESYTKSVRNMVLAEEEAERNLAQAIHNRWNVKLRISMSMN